MTDRMLRTGLELDAVDMMDSNSAWMTIEGMRRGDTKDV